MKTPTAKPGRHHARPTWRSRIRTFVLVALFAPPILYLLGLWFLVVTAQQVIQASATEYGWDLLLAREGNATYKGRHFDNNRLRELIVHFRNHPNLTLLTLQNTTVDDEGIEYLAELTKLKRLVLIDSFVAQEGVKRLQKSLPALKVDLVATNQPKPAAEFP